MNENTKNYKNFDVLKAVKVPDCKSTAYYLKDKVSGLEVLHLYNDDKENLCAFAFRTPVENSCGTPHIIEHSVLCGSQRFPLKDPFIHLENQSVKTYLNAMTFLDRTVYPISSLIEKDYFNLARVYADAVFFPRLTKEAFMQEGHRLEKGKDGKYVISGVVYNEMKGCYSDFDSVCCDSVYKTMMKGTIYDKDSGGDPLEIPELTYEEFKAFHKKYYQPDNCLVFLYGNIPTETQLDFLQENVLDRLPEAKNEKSPALDIFENIKLPPLDPNFITREIAPNSINDTEQKSSVTVSYRCGRAFDPENNMELTTLLEILCNNDGSPLKKALLQSKLGNDLSSSMGINNVVWPITVTLGLQGVKKEDETKVTDLIEQELKKISENPIDPEIVEGAIMSMDFEFREIKRFSGPFSLVLMRRVLRSWVYGKDPVEPLLIRKYFERIKDKIRTDPSYLNSLVKKYFVDNKEKAVIIVTPDSSFTQVREKKEEELVERLLSKTDKKLISKQNKQLLKYQKSREDLSCLPHLKPEELDAKSDKIDTKVKWLEYSPQDKIPFIYNLENTNAINYFEIGFPCDVLEPEDYKYIPLLTDFIPELGFDGLSWDQASTKMAGVLGSCVATQFCSTVTHTPDTERLLEEYKPYGFAGRDWVIFRIKMLEEKTSEGLDILYKLLTTCDFSDTDRIKTLLDEEISDAESAIVSEGLSLISSRLNSRVSRTKAVNEIWKGLSQIYTLRELAGKEEFLAKKLSELSKIIFSSGAIVHLTGDSETFNKNQDCIIEFCRKLKPATLAPKNEKGTRGCFAALTRLADNPVTADEVFEKEMQVGYAAVSTTCSERQSLEACAEDVFCHWFTNNTLWECMRTICGAYGAYAGTNGIEKTFHILTYRDPDPFKSIKEMWKCLKAASAKKFSEEDTQKVITGSYSDVIQPKTPDLKGLNGFMRTLYCDSEKDREQRIAWLLSLTPKDLENAAKRLYKNSVKESHFAVLVPEGTFDKKRQKNAGKIQKILL